MSAAARFLLSDFSYRLTGRQYSGSGSSVYYETTIAEPTDPNALFDPRTSSTTTSSARADVEELERVGVDAILVGEALMRASDPEAAVRELTRTEEPTQA